MTTQNPNDNSDPGTPAAAPTGNEGDVVEQPLEFDHYVDFAEQWLFPNTAVRIAGTNREGTYSWCPQWWRHRPVVVRIAALHDAFETAVASTDGSAMSNFLVHHVDPTVRALLDAVNGPMHRCTLDQHSNVSSLPSTPVPPGWFGKDVGGGSI